MKIKELLNQELTFSPKTVEITKLFASIIKNLKYSIFFNIIAFIGLADICAYAYIYIYLPSQAQKPLTGGLVYHLYFLFYFILTRIVSICLLVLLLIEKKKKYKIKGNKIINNIIYDFFFWVGMIIYIIAIYFVSYYAVWIFLICLNIIFRDNFGYELIH